MTSKERARLKGLAAHEDAIVQIGKGGITDSVIASVNTALLARELVKGRVLESSLLSSREACESLASACGAEAVQAIGNVFVLYRKNPEKKAETKPEKKPAKKPEKKPEKKPGTKTEKKPVKKPGKRPEKKPEKKSGPRR